AGVSFSGSNRRVVIVGAGAAGDAAAEALRKAGFDGPVSLVGAERHVAYHRPYLSKQFLRGEVPLERVHLRHAEAYDHLGIEWLGGRTAVAGSRRNRSITLDDGRELRFDVLVLATGGTPRWPEGVPRLDNVLALRTLDDGVALGEALARSRRLLVMGAGFIGAEVAASARVLGKEALVVEPAPVPLARVLGEDMGEVYARLHRERGVDLRLSTSVVEWIPEGDHVAGVRLSDGTREEVDLVLVAAGIQPELSLAGELELPLGAGGVLVDETLQAAPDVYCAGDIAAHRHPVYGRHLRVEHWQVARKQGQAIGQAIATGPRPYEELPWFWSDQYEVNLQYLGHASGFDRSVWRGDTGSGHFSVFYLKDERLEAVLAVNDARTIRLSRDLIRQRPRLSAYALLDETADLRELARSYAHTTNGANAPEKEVFSHGE
ncbi:MAG: NAD(P)/FAD-dependent oxidoreductase, partial [Candidatus Dormibacteraeota bacterium]|nr:NAD(P)/FAD-dependent oxidoreductase [Candidatus Dormibacteraeota bacterium]